MSHGPLGKEIKVSGCGNRFSTLRLSGNSISISSLISQQWLYMLCGIFLIFTYHHICICLFSILEIPWNGENFKKESIALIFEERIKSFTDKIFIPPNVLEITQDIKVFFM